MNDQEIKDIAHYYAVRYHNDRFSHECCTGDCSFIGLLEDEMIKMLKEYRQRIFARMCDKELEKPFLGQCGSGSPAMKQSGQASIVEKRKELKKELTGVLDTFHKENSELYVVSISLSHHEYATGRKELVKLDVSVEVQGCKKL